MSSLIQHNYHVYIVTNPEKKILYTGVTNSLQRRLIEHWINRGKDETFAGKYYCYNLIHYEHFQHINYCTGKRNKRMVQTKKIEPYRHNQSAMAFLNASVCDGWPPGKMDKPL